MPKTLSLGRMIQDKRGISFENFNDVVYFTHSGITNTCSGYQSCSISAPRYAYQYCTSISSIFDGMFNLEIPVNVPVRVSEQSLYDPYGESTQEINLIGCEGVGEGGLDC